PPRTYESENKHKRKTNDQKVPSSNSNSPSFDLGARSVSCMDLTAGVSTVLLPPNVMSVKRENQHMSRRPSVSSEKTKKKSSKTETIFEQTTIK
ncbi:unnamed protein product, partial [Adineta steineri]